MEIELTHIEVKKVEIDFQKIFDYISNEDGNSLETIDDYDIIFGDNLTYYLKETHDLSFDNDDSSYYELSDYKYDVITNEFYGWLKTNKERLNLKDD